MRIYTVESLTVAQLEEKQVADAESFRAMHNAIAAQDAKLYAENNRFSTVNLELSTELSRLSTENIRLSKLLVGYRNGTRGPLPARRPAPPRLPMVRE